MNAQVLSDQNLLNQYLSGDKSAISSLIERHSRRVRDYIHVVDLARGHVCAIEYMANHKGENVFNLGTGMGYSVLDMVKAFERVTGIKIPYEIAPRRPGDLATVYSSPDKSAQLLGWKAQYNLDDMCRDTWAWQSKNPMGYGE